MGNYLALTKSPEIFTEVTSLDIYYNRLYWFIKARAAYIKLTGKMDAGLSQQLSLIVEEGEGYADISWTEVETIIDEESFG